MLAALLACGSSCDCSCGDDDDALAPAAPTASAAPGASEPEAALIWSSAPDSENPDSFRYRTDTTRWVKLSDCSTLHERSDAVAFAGDRMWAVIATPGDEDCSNGASYELVDLRRDVQVPAGDDCSAVSVTGIAGPFVMLRVCAEHCLFLSFDVTAGTYRAVLTPDDRTAALLATRDEAMDSLGTLPNAAGEEAPAPNLILAATGTTYLLGQLTMVHEIAALRSPRQDGQWTEDDSSALVRTPTFPASLAGAASAPEAVAHCLSTDDTLLVGYSLIPNGSPEALLEAFRRTLD